MKRREQEVICNDAAVGVKANVMAVVIVGENGAALLHTFFGETWKQGTGRGVVRRQAWWKFVEQQVFQWGLKRDG